MSQFWLPQCNWGVPSCSSTLPASPGTTSLAWNGGHGDLLEGEGGSRGDRPFLPLPSLSRAVPPGEAPWGTGAEEGARTSGNKLKWVDALSAWVPHKPSSQNRGKDDSCRQSQRKAYSSPLYDPEALRKSRTVRVEAPRTASNSPQPVVLPEQIDVPLAVFENDGTLLEGENFEMIQAREELQEHMVMVEVKDSTPPVDEILDPPAIVSDLVEWPEVVEERVPTPEPEVVETTPEEELLDPPEEAESASVATSSTRQPIKALSPRPSPVSAATPVEEPCADSSISECMTPPPPLPPVVARRPIVVDPEEAETAKTNLVGLRSRLSSRQRAKPKPKPNKERAPVVEKTPRQLPKPELVEKPSSTPAKPVKLPKALAPKPAKHPRSARPKRELKEKKKGPVSKPVPLPISPPEEIKPPERVKAQPRASPVARARVKKKEKLPPPPPRRRTPTPPPKPPTPVFEWKEGEDWTFSSDEEEKREEEKEKDGLVTLELPPLPPSLPTPTPMASPRMGAGREGRSTMNMSLVALKTKPRWGQKQKDMSLLDEEERQRLAEERRWRHAAMMDKYKRRKSGEKESEENGGPSFEDYGFLAKYCILNHSTTDKYRYTFDHLDEGGKGYLTEDETAYGLRAINPSLSVLERTYLFRILEMAGHKMKLGTDFKLFSILAALSQRVARLDEWARHMMAEMDYRNLEMKLFLCKTLWECNVDDSTNTISLDQLIVELRAGGVSPKHENEVRTKLADHRYLDFFDFLMYVPLFITIHETVVTDPLSVTRTL